MDRSGFTPLHLAAMRGSVEVAALLLEHKADPNSRTISSSEARPVPMRLRSVPAGCTPLHLAALSSQTNVIQLLLKSGAAINATNSMGGTALDLASRPDWRAGAIWTQSGLTTMPDLTDGEAPTQNDSARSFVERQKASAGLLEKNGGKRSHPTQPMFGSPFF